MRLNSVSVRLTDDAVRLVGEAESDRHPAPFELYFEYPREFGDFVEASADAFAVAMLVPSMLQGESLHIVPPISPRLHFHLPRVRDIFHTWHPYMWRSEIETTPGPRVAARPPIRAATFFSGGVDSFYTLLKYQGHESLPAPLTHIIFMRGLEKPLDFLRGVEDAQQLIQTIADKVGVRLIAGESNLRTYFDADWLYLYCGSGLSAAALSLGNGFSHVCIPSTYSYRDAVATGTTPIVDERYSTERVQIVHEGAELGRAGKLGRIVEWNRDLVLKHMRVCVMNFGGAYNCCECRKCVRTLMPLRSLGVLEQATTFPNKSMDHWRAVATLDALPFVQENLEFARAHNNDPVLTAQLERIVLRRRQKEALRYLLETSPLRGLFSAALWTKRRIQHLRASPQNN